MAPTPPHIDHPLFIKILLCSHQVPNVFPKGSQWTLILRGHGFKCFWLSSNRIALFHWTLDLTPSSSKSGPQFLSYMICLMFFIYCSQMFSCGLPHQPFFFIGEIPPKSKIRNQKLENEVVCGPFFFPPLIAKREEKNIYNCKFSIFGLRVSNKNYMND